MNGNRERKRVRLFGIDSEPNVYDACVEEIEDGVFELKSMKKVGEWQKRDQKMRLEEKINCPSNFGEITRSYCYECEYRTLEVCPVGTAFVRDRAVDKPVYEPYLAKEGTSETVETIKGELVCCPKCSEEHFTLRKVTLSDRMLASAKLNVVCINCAYTESLYEIGGKKE